jgi:propionate CoA-transferase
MIADDLKTMPTAIFAEQWGGLGDIMASADQQ